MADGVNEVRLIGNMGQGFEFSYLPSGTPVTRFNLGTTKGRRNQASGQREESTQWHRIVVYGRMAEVLNERAGIGAQLYIAGELEYRTFGQPGQERTIAEIVVNAYDGKVNILKFGKSRTENND